MAAPAAKPRRWPGEDPAVREAARTIELLDAAIALGDWARAWRKALFGNTGAQRSRHRRCGARAERRPGSGRAVADETEGVGRETAGGGPVPYSAEQQRRRRETRGPGQRAADVKASVARKRLSRARRDLLEAAEPVLRRLVLGK